MNVMRSSFIHRCWTVLLCAPVGWAADLAYTIQMTSDPHPALAVEVRFDVTPEGPKELVLPNEYGGEREMWRWISDLEVVAGPVKLTPGDLPFLRRILASGNGPCHIRYLVSVPPGPLTQGLYRRPVIRDSYLHLLGNTFLVRPSLPEHRRVQVQLEWNLPETWRIGNSFGMGQRRQKIEASLFELVQSVYLAGDFRFVEREVHGKPVAAALRGEWGFTDGEFADLVQRIVKAQRELWRDDSFGFYFVSLLPVDISPGSTSGVGRWNGFSAFLRAGSAIDERVRYLLSHELFHTWIPGKLIASGSLSPALYWLSEGFTEYYSYVLLLLADLETFPEFLAHLNRKISEYWTSPARNMTNAQAGREYFTNEQAGRLAYLRGLVVALTWNAALRATSGGRASLTNLNRALRERSQDGKQPVDMAIIAEEAARLGLPDAAKQLASWVEAGDTVEVRPDSFGPCGELVSEQGGPPRFRLKASMVANQCVAWFR